MRLLDRYLLRELLVPLAYCLGGFLLFWVSFDLFATLGRFRRNNLSVEEIARYYVVVTPEFLILVLPIALLLALLYTLTSHARHHELTAIRAAGVSLWRLSAPYFGVGIVMSLAAFGINELWVPRSSQAADEILLRHKDAGPGKVKDLPFANTRDGRIWHIPLYDMDTAEMTRPEVLWTAEDGSRMQLLAANGLHTNGAWTFYNVTLYRYDTLSNSQPEKVLVTNELVMAEFGETPELVRSEVKVSRSLTLGESRHNELAISEIRNYLRLHPNPSSSDAAWLFTKLQGRFAAPWTCLVVVLIAIPFGVASGRRNIFLGVAGSITICFVYFVLQQLALALGTGGYAAPWLAAWLPNLVFACAGLLLMFRVR